MSHANRLTMIVAAALCVAVAAVHIDDQGGLTAFAQPDWFGWSYRLIEVAAIVVAGALVFCAGAAVDATRSKVVWVAAGLLGAGPFGAYILTRTVGLPGDSGDIGNWDDTVGIVSLVVEGLLVLLAIRGVLSRSASVSTQAQRRHEHVLTA